MKANTKHISLSVVIAIISFGIFSMTLQGISSNGITIQGHPIVLLVSCISLSAGTFFAYFAKWLYDIEKMKQN